MERVPNSAHESLRLDDSSSHVDVHDRDLRTGVRGVCRWALDAARRPTSRGGRGGDSIRARRVPRELHGRPALVALSFLRVAGRDRSGPRLHRSGRHAGEMVSGSSRHDHGHRRCRIRYWRAGGGANRDATHRASRSAADVLHLRHRVSAGRHRGRTLHAESACGISSCGLGASGQPAAGREIGDAGRGRRELAVVRALGAAVPEHYRRHRHHLAGRAHGPGGRWRLRRARGKPGRDHLHRQRRRALPLGVAVRFRGPARRSSC